MLSRSTKLIAAVLLAAATGARADFIDLYADKLDMPRNKAPRVGRSKVVLIPVEIDNAGYDPIDQERVRAFFGQDTGAGLTFSSYYDAASGGKLHLDVTVAPVVKYDGCPSMIKTTAGCTIPRGDVSALTQGMDFVRDVFRRAHDEGKVDFSQFDSNGLGGQPDGVIDGAMIVVNVPHAGIALPIQYVNSGSNLNGGTGGSLKLDGIEIPYVAVGGASTVNGAQHVEYVILHEFAHTLGFADLYYEHPSSGDKYPQWGGLHFSLMGDYDYDDKVPLPDAESRRALGWQQHQVISGTRAVTLAPAAMGGGAVKLGMVKDGRTEYFLAEARGPVAGIDNGLLDSSGNPAYGLAIYHVDWGKGPSAQVGAWTSRLLYCLDCDPYHPFIRNLESSGTFALVSTGSNDVGHAAVQGGVPDDMVLWQGGAVTSRDGAAPLSGDNRYVATNFYDGSVSGISVRDIKVNADHTITATFTAPDVSDPCSDVICPALEQCVKSGVSAGNCQPITQVIPEPGPAATPAATGCSGAGTPGLAGLLLLALLFGLRRRQPAL